MMKITLYMDDDDRHHDDDHIVCEWWWSHCIRMIMIPSYMDDDNDDDRIKHEWWWSYPTLMMMLVMISIQTMMLIMVASYMHRRYMMRMKFSHGTSDKAIPGVGRIQNKVGLADPSRWGNDGGAAFLETRCGIKTEFPRSGPPHPLMHHAPCTYTMFELPRCWFILKKLWHPEHAWM